EESLYLTEKIAESKGSPISIQEYLVPSMSNNISALVFGSRYLFDDPKRKFLDEQLASALRLLGSSMIVNFLPSWLNTLALRIPFLTISSFKNVFRELSDFVSKEVKEHQETLDEHSNRDFIDGYIKKIKEHENDPDSSFQTRFLFGNVLNFFGAGSNTVMVTIMWHLLTYAKYPDTVQAKIQREIDEVGGYAQVVQRGHAPLKVAVATQTSFLDYRKPLQSPTPKLKIELPGRAVSAGGSTASSSQTTTPPALTGQQSVPVSGEGAQTASPSQVGSATAKPVRSPRSPSRERGPRSHEKTSSSKERHSSCATPTPKGQEQEVSGASLPGTSTASLAGGGRGRRLAPRGQSLSIPSGKVSPQDPEPMDESTQASSHASDTDDMEWQTPKARHKSKKQVTPPNASEDVFYREYFIPKGSMVLANLWTVHMDPKLWKDPQNFDPSRFLTKDGTELGPKPESLMPFSVGKRMCPGETLATVEVFLNITTLLQKYNVLPEEGQVIDLSTKGAAVIVPETQKLRFIPR
ncbi:cytochrome P450 2A4, partial [Ixodes scapularis]